jgi:hypothetical protein
MRWENPPWINAIIAGMVIRRAHVPFAAIVELGGRCPEHWHAVRRGAKLPGRHGTHGSNRHKLRTGGSAMLFIDY